MYRSLYPVGRSTQADRRDLETGLLNSRENGKVTSCLLISVAWRFRGLIRASRNGGVSHSLAIRLTRDASDAETRIFPLARKQSVPCI